MSQLNKPLISFPEGLRTRVVGPLMRQIFYKFIYLSHGGRTPWLFLGLLEYNYCYSYLRIGDRPASRIYLVRDGRLLDGPLHSRVW